MTSQNEERFSFREMSRQNAPVQETKVRRERAVKSSVEQNLKGKSDRTNDFLATLSHEECRRTVREVGIKM